MHPRSVLRRSFPHPLKGVLHIGMKRYPYTLVLNLILPGELCELVSFLEKRRMVCYHGIRQEHKEQQKAPQEEKGR